MNIDEIRLLLDRYYDGTATDSEIDALTRYFVGTHRIPADMRADQAIFRAMASHSQPGMPTDLQRKIVAATYGDSSRTLRRRWTFALTAAATILLVLAIGLSYFTEKPTPDTPQIAVSTVRNPGPGVSQEISCPQEVSHADTIKTLPKIHRERKEEPVMEMNPSSNFREVTDSAEVVEITSRIFAILDKSLSKTEAGVKQTEMAFALLSDPLGANETDDNHNK